MPVKWKIFFALNIVTALLSFMLLFSLVMFIRAESGIKEEYLSFGISIFALCVVILNSFLNIFFLQRYYPDKIASRSVRRITMLSFILTIIITACFLVASIILGEEEFSTNDQGLDTSDKIKLAIIFLLTILLIIVLIMQGQLPRFIRRNHQMSVHSLIDSIGQSSEQEN